MNTQQNNSNPINLSEAALIKQAQKGDQAAFMQLVESYHKRIFNIGLRMLGNPDDAADMAQETLLKIYRRLADFRGEAAFSTWVYRVAVNTCKDMLRSACRRKEITFTDFCGEDDDIVFNIPDYRNLPEHQYEEQLSAQRLRELIDALDPRFRIVILLREIGGLNYGEIAAAVNISEGTVKSRISRARAAMRKVFVQSGTGSSTASSDDTKGVS